MSGRPSQLGGPQPATNKGCNGVTSELFSARWGRLAHLARSSDASSGNMLIHHGSHGSCSGMPPIRVATMPKLSSSWTTTISASHCCLAQPGLCPPKWYSWRVGREIWTPSWPPNSYGCPIRYAPGELPVPSSPLRNRATVDIYYRQVDNWLCLGTNGHGNVNGYDYHWLWRWTNDAFECLETVSGYLCNMTNPNTIKEYGTCAKWIGPTIVLQWPFSCRKTWKVTRQVQVKQGINDCDDILWHLWRSKDCIMTTN